MNEPRTARPLIINTRPGAQSHNLTILLEAIGVDVCELPMIRVRFPDDWKSIVLPALPIGQDDWFFVTSVNGAIALDQIFCALSEPCDRLQQHVAAVGEVTSAKLRELGFSPAISASDENAETLARDFLRSHPDKKSRCLVVKGNRAGELLPELLRSSGHSVLEFVTYFTEDTELPSSSDIEFLLKHVDRIAGVCFYSPSAVRNFEKFLKSITANISLHRKLYSCTAFCIGKQTEESAMKVGFTERSVALKRSDEALVSRVRAALFPNDR